MNIYLASSWKNKEAVLRMASILRSEGYLVDAFCEEDNRISFSWDEITNEMSREGKNRETLTAIDMMKDWRVQAAFKEDRKYLDWADIVVMLMPCGRSAHIEAGYMVGKGKKLYILGGFESGESEVMYGFASGMYNYTEIDNFLNEMNNDIRQVNYKGDKKDE